MRPDVDLVVTCGNRSARDAAYCEAWGEVNAGYTQLLFGCHRGCALPRGPLEGQRVLEHFSKPGVSSMGEENDYWDLPTADVRNAFTGRAPMMLAMMLVRPGQLGSYDHIFYRSNV